MAEFRNLLNHYGMLHYLHSLRFLLQEMYLQAINRFIPYKAYLNYHHSISEVYHSYRRTHQDLLQRQKSTNFRHHLSLKFQILTMNLDPHLQKNLIHYRYQYPLHLRLLFAFIKITHFQFKNKSKIPTHTFK